MKDQISSPPPATPSDATDHRELRALMTSPVGDYEPFENEDEILGDQTVHDEEDEEGEELFGDNMEDDYRPMPHLDHYEHSVDDNDDFSPMSQGERLAAEAELDRRDRAMGIHRDDRNLVYGDSEDERDDDMAHRGKRQTNKSLAGEIEEPDVVESIENLEDTKGHATKEWVVMLGPRTEISNRFQSFLRTFVDSRGAYTYRDRIRRMCEQNLSSFVVSYTDLANKEHVLAYFLPEAPFQMLEIFDTVAKNMVLSIYPTYERVTSEIHVRISELPLVEEIRTFRKLHLNQLVRTLGVVTATTGVLPQLSVIKFDCVKCGYILGPFVQTQNTEIKPGSCPECQSVGPFSVRFK